MLKQLYIKNFTLIDELDIELYPGFSVLTGETGAGKSIILGAIGLLLGQRADSKKPISTYPDMTSSRSSKRTTSTTMPTTPLFVERSQPPRAVPSSTTPLWLCRC